MNALNNITEGTEKRHEIYFRQMNYTSSAVGMDANAYCTWRDSL